VPALQYGNCLVDLSFEDRPLVESYSDEHQDLAAWILFKKRPEHLSRAELRKFKHKAKMHYVREGHLFTLPTGGRPLRRVVDDPSEREEIVRAMHDEAGHRGKEHTWQKVWMRY
jgi:hypothetical protein